MPLGCLVYVAFDHDVTHVFVRGHLIFSDGKLRSANQGEILELVDEEVRNMLVHAGIKELVTPRRISEDSHIMSMAEEIKSLSGLINSSPDSPKSYVIDASMLR